MHPERSDKPVSKVICSYDDGTEQRLYATGFSTSGAWILSMDPPELGTRFDVTLFPNQLDELPTLRCLVTRVIQDPADARRNGFEIAFLDLDPASIARLTHALEFLDRIGKMVSPRGVERRSAARIAVNLLAVIETASGTHQCTVLDLSMPGALLVPRDAVPREEIEPGKRVGLVVNDPAAPESVEIQALIMRQSERDGQPMLGVQFLDVNRVQRGRIEALMLDALADTATASSAAA